MSWFRLIAALLLLPLGACGFEPIHGGGPRGAATDAALAAITIEPIRERTGQLLRNNLLDSISPYGEPARPAYRLQVDVRESKQELAVRKSELATRSNLVLTATYRLFDISRNAQVMSRSSSVTASYNLLDNEFATLVAEADARERGVRELSDDITRQLSLYLRSQARAEPR